MPVLHKFMSMDIFESFCCDPCFRITPSWDQNDEEEFCIDETPALKEAEIHFGGDARERLKKYMDFHGVVSLCNDLMSSHMWDRYADNQKGIAISVEVPEDDPFSLFVNSSSPGFSLSFDRGFLYSPVDYTDTPSIELNNFHPETFLKYHLTKKKEEWKIEDESRIILPFDFTSRILANESGVEKINIVLSRYGLPPVSINNNNGAYLEIDGAFIEYFIAYSKTEALADIWNAAKSHDVIFLARIDTGVPGVNCGALRRVTIGENADVERFLRIIESSRDCSFSISERLICPLSKRISGVYQAKLETGMLEKVESE
ncbi:DUF2971 domain-containing protein [Chromohalobacter sp. 11-W]|uniref:DUF2971 domain-containing protein n=1 Tax=Chromohalobacter sp. 11-W TaxID=2994061 RepID=UPI0024689960|nr:DUF2971 domain-containing protein [Chromohalobacter sp. 11-W]